MFTPFYTTSVEAGRGLGLATCRRIVEAHGGTLLVDSVHSKGATFTVTLPYVMEDAVPMVFVQDKTAERALRILAVDDMAATVNLLQAGLDRFGYTVVTALSGPEAVRIFKDSVIDLVICDLGMPGMNGWQVGRVIREICKARGTSAPPFIILTGWEDQASELDKIAESGVDAVIQKPVEITKLNGAIQEVLRQAAGHP